MKFEENSFIREATKSLFSSLHIEKALFKTFSYLKNYFPLELAHMFIYDMETKTMRYLSLATDKGGVLIDERMQLTDMAVREFERYELGSINIFVKSESTLIKEVFSHFNLNTSDPFFDENEDLSVMGTMFDLESPLTGGFGLVTRGSDAYTRKDIKKLNLITGALTGAVHNLLHHRDVVCLNERLKAEKTELQRKLGHVDATGIIGAESGLKDVMEMVDNVAPTNSPVLITGETGVGKEVIANAIHQSSGRKDGPFICINCGTIPESLADSELFGHEKGAFTGASQRKRGVFEQANYGTIFLDEIGELPLKTQVKFLRVLQTNEFQRIGGTRNVSVDLRVIAATNRNLIEMVKRGLFREDLWFRLNVFPIEIPPLRKRREDIRKLSEYFLIRKSREMNIENIPQIPQDSMEKLKNYRWPGNIRELQNLIERALILNRNGVISFPDLEPEREKEIENKSSRKILPMDDMVMLHIKKALEDSGGKVDGKGGAAELLGLNTSTLRGKMRKYGIKINKKVEF